MTYRGARLLGLRPPLAYGGHSFRLSMDAQVCQCLRCHGVCPAWSLRERLWPLFIGTQCPDLLRALRA